MTSQPDPPGSTLPASQPGGPFLANVQKFIAWIVANRENILRHAWIAQVFAGLIFLGLGYFMGHSHLHLVLQGQRAPGTIIGYKQEYFRNSSGFSSAGYMPLVAFRTGDRSVQFQDWLGAHISGNTNVSVIVLYDPANPTTAMIDRPVWNWIPWAPISAVGLFLLFVAVKGALRSLS